MINPVTHSVTDEAEVRMKRQKLPISDRSAKQKRAVPSIFPLLLALYALSGFCSLASETIWIRALSVRIGNTVETATLVLTVFFLCAAAGNWWGSRVVARQARPAGFYGRCELLSAGTAALLFPCRHLLYALVHAPESGVGLVSLHFCYTLLLVGVPSFFAGSTFPALSEAFILKTDERARVGGALYAGNLLGAAAGVLGGGLGLPYLLGDGASFAIAVLLQASIGTAALLASRRWSTPHHEASTSAPSTLPPTFGIIVLAGSGVLSLMLEMLVLSYFQQFTTASLYAMTAVLFAFIVNLGLGSLLVAWWRRLGWRAERLLFGALMAGGVQLLLYPLLLHRLLHTHPLAPQPSITAWTAGAICSTTLFFAPLLIVVGMVFPLAWEIIERSNPHHGEALGHAVAINKVGSAVGVFLGPFVLVPWLGLPATMMAAGWGYLALALWSGWRLPMARPARLVFAGATLAVLVLAVGAFTLRRPPVALGDGEKLLALYQGANGVIAVSEDAQGSRHIVLNQTYTLNGTNRALLSQQQESWLPLLLSPHPRQVAFIGVASGISATATLDFPIEHLTAVELCPEVVRAARAQFSAWNRPLFTDPRARVVVNDGRFVLQSSPAPFDLVICDLFLPALEGTGSLYSRDFFAAARGRLAPGGLFCLWLPMYQLDDAMTGMVLRTFTDVFPHAILIRGNFDPLQPTVAVIGANEPIDLSDAALARRLNTPTGHKLAAVSPFFRSVANARLCFIGDLAAVHDDFHNHYPLNTDDNQRFTFLGPKRPTPEQILCGYPLLRYFGTRFLHAGLPSCTLGTTPQDELVNSMRAGNYYFAASIAGLDIPVDFTEQMKRARQTMGYLKQAAELSPKSELGEVDLGR